MLENLLEFYRKSDGATKKKILSTIFAEKLVLERGKIMEPFFTEPIKMTFKIGDSLRNKTGEIVKTDSSVIL